MITQSHSRKLLLQCCCGTFLLQMIIRGKHVIIMNRRAMFRKQAALWVKNICDQNNFIVNYMHYNNKWLLQSKVSIACKQPIDESAIYCTNYNISKFSDNSRNGKAAHCRSVYFFSQLLQRRKQGFLSVKVGDKVKMFPFLCDLSRITVRLAFSV